MSQSQSILRWVVLDDDDPSIAYGPGWSRDENDFANQGSSGPVYKGSQHVTTQSGSLTFRFNGTRVRLMGTSNVDRSSGAPDPRWECFVDGQSIGFEQAFETHQNNWPLCITPGSLDDGEHTLTLNVTTSRGQPFYLDQVRILPSPDLERQPPNPSVIVEQSDTAVTFSNEEDWPSLNSSIRSTSADGAGLSMDFTGTKLSFIGWRLQGDYAESSAQFSIDDAPPKPFPIPPVPSGSGSQFFHTFFETPTLPPGSHNLQVTYEGKGRNPAPLALDFLLIENGDIVGPGNGTETPVDEPQPSNAAASPSATSAPAKTPLGAIIGGAVGGAALIALFVTVLLLIRRRMRSNRKLPSFASFAQFSHRSPEPRYPRQSFSEAMVRKSSTSRSTTASIISVPNLNYNSTYSNSGHSRKASSYMESDVELSQQSLIPATKLTPLRRNMVQGGSIPE